jgi:hypothetical protein
MAAFSNLLFQKALLTSEALASTMDEVAARHSGGSAGGRPSPRFGAGPDDGVVDSQRGHEGTWEKNP